MDLEKKSKKNVEVEEVIDISDDKITEKEIFNIASVGSLVEDIQKFEMKMSKVPDIEVREIIIRETGNFLNLKDNVINIPMEMLIFPFFTPQKQNKRINFQYKFEDMGVTMLSTLIVKSGADKVFQPSIFEEKIYTYLISMYEVQKEEEDSEEYIDFEIADFIENFLGNKMNRTYYTKVEQALKNLKNTEYQFTVSNHTKLGKFKFEDEEFKLLTYQKLKIGKKVYYRVILNKNIRKKIKEKRYVKYNSKPLVEIMNLDPIASRIYKYISFKRMDEDSNRINIRTLAAIIPLKTEQITERVGKDGKTKEYILCRMKQVLARILKAFDVLKDLGYIKSCVEEYDKEQNTYYLTYTFNKEKDWVCHISSYLENNTATKTKKITSEKKSEVKPLKTIVKTNSKPVEIAKIIKTEFSENILLRIQKAKKNLYISKAWDKRVETKIEKIYKQYGEDFTIIVLNNLSKLNGPVKTTLIQYLNGMLTNILSEQNGNINKTQKAMFDLEQPKVIGKVNLTKTGIKRASKVVSVPITLKNPSDLSIDNKNISYEKKIEEVISVYEALDELEKLKIEQQALKLCCKEKNIQEGFLLKMKENLPPAYKSAVEPYIQKILEESLKK